MLLLPLLLSISAHTFQFPFSLLVKQCLFQEALLVTVASKNTTDSTTAKVITQGFGGSSDSQSRCHVTDSVDKDELCFIYPERMTE